MRDDPIDILKKYLRACAEIAVMGMFYGGAFVACAGYSLLLLNSIAENWHPETLWEATQMMLGYGLAIAFGGLLWWIFVRLVRDAIAKWKSSG